MFLVALLFYLTLWPSTFEDMCAAPSLSSTPPLTLTLNRMRAHGLSLRPVAIIVGFNLAGEHFCQLPVLLLPLLLRDAAAAAAAAAAVDAAAAAMLCTYETWHVLLYSRPPSSSIRERKFNKEDQYAPPGNLLRERLLTTAGAPLNLKP